MKKADENYISLFVLSVHEIGEIWRFIQRRKFILQFFAITAAPLHTLSATVGEIIKCDWLPAYLNTTTITPISILITNYLTLPIGEIYKITIAVYVATKLYGTL